MKSAILTVGTEILFGQITNTNSIFLSRELNAMGIDVMYHYAVGDNPTRLKETLIHALRDCDLVISTGGLGPTQDDLTKEMICEVMNASLELNEEALEGVKCFFRNVNRRMTDSNVKQAYVPSCGIPFLNSCGTAPGFGIEQDGKIVIALPGPPREMKAMFEKSVRPFLNAKLDAVIYFRSVKTFGLGESLVEDALKPLIDQQTDPTLATYAKEGEVEVRVTSKRKTLEEAEQAVLEMLPKMEALLGDHIFTYDGEEFYDVVADKLLAKNITVSCAESCTGGLFAATMTRRPGISAIFERGLTTYSTQAKIEELNVSQEVIDQYGVFSEEMAIAMAKGLKEKTGSRLNIAITGLAGPDGGEGKPVGLYYICCILDDRMETKEYMFHGRTRDLIREYMVLSMLDLINKMVD